MTPEGKAAIARAQKRRWRKFRKDNQVLALRREVLARAYTLGKKQVTAEQILKQIKELLKAA